MRKFLLAGIFLIGIAVCLRAANTITGYVQVNPPNAPQPGGFNTQSGTVGTLTATNATATNLTAGNATISSLPANQCLQTTTGGLITTTGGQCSAGSVVGSTGTPLSVTVGGVIITSPTFQLNFPTANFTGALTGGATSNIDLNTTVGAGQGFIISNPASQQPAALNVTTTTALAGEWGSSTATNGPGGGSAFHGAYVYVRSSGTTQGVTIDERGVPAGGGQAQAGALTVRDDSAAGGPAATLVVLVDSRTSNQTGTALLDIYSLSNTHNDPLIYVHRNSSNSSPEMRWDSPSPNMEMVCTSTNNAVGRGKWEPFATPAASEILQVNSRAWDNTTFENVAYWEPLDIQKSVGGPGLYLRAQDLTNDSGILSSSNTAGVNFFTQNNHTIGITGPLNVASGSWRIRLPSTIPVNGQTLQVGSADSFGDYPTSWVTAGSTVLQSSGVAFGSATNTISQDTTTFTYDSTHQSISVYNKQTDPVVSGTFYPNLEIKKKSGNTGCEYWDNDSTTSGFAICNKGLNFSLGSATNIGGNTGLAHFIDLDTTGSFPTGSTVTIQAPLIVNAGMTLGGAGNIVVTENNLSGQVILGTQTAPTNGHLAVWSSSMSLIDGGAIPSGGAGTGITSPATFTWTNSFGINVSTIVAPLFSVTSSSVSATNFSASSATITTKLGLNTDTHVSNGKVIRFDSTNGDDAAGATISNPYGVGINYLQIQSPHGIGIQVADANNFGLEVGTTSVFLSSVSINDALTVGSTVTFSDGLGIKAGPYYDVTAFGAKHDYRSASNANCGSLGNNVLVRTGGGSATFTPADVGDRLALSNCNTSSTTFVTHIASVLGASSVTVTDVIPNPMGSGMGLEWGHDDTSAINSAIQAAVNYQAPVYLPGGDYYVSQINWRGGIELKGAGMARSSANDTELHQWAGITLADGTNVNGQVGMINTTTGISTQYGSISDIVMEGSRSINASSDTIGTAITISASSNEGFTFNKIFIGDFACNGVYQSTAASLNPFTAYDVHTFRNGQYSMAGSTICGYGFNMDRGSGVQNLLIDLYHWSGDNNKNALLRIANPVKWSGSLPESYVLSGIKCERNDDNGEATPREPNCLVVDVASNTPLLSPISINGMSFNNTVNTTVTSSAAVRIMSTTGNTGTPLVDWTGVSVQNLGTLGTKSINHIVENDITGVNYDQASGSLSPKIFASTTTTTGQFNVNGGLYYGTPNSKNASYTVKSTDTVVLASATLNAGITITLPASNANNVGQTLTISKVDGSTQAITITPNGTDLISGTGTVTLNAFMQTDSIMADGNGNWIPWGQGIQVTPPLYINAYGASAASALASSSATYSQAFYAPVPSVVKAFRLAATATTSNVDVGIYDKNYKLLGNTGALAAVSGEATYTLTTPLYLPPGYYYMAFTASNVTNTFQRLAGNAAQQNCNVDTTDAALPLPSAPNPNNFGTTALCFLEAVLINGGVTQ